MNLKISKTTSEILHNKKLISKKRKNPYLITNNKKISEQIYVTLLLILI